MAIRGGTALALVALFGLAPILAVVIIAVLLLFGAPPHLVFLPGFALKARLEAFGLHVPNAVGVLTTALLWWAAIVIVWLAVRRVWRGASRAH